MRAVAIFLVLAIPSIVLAQLPPGAVPVSGASPAPIQPGQQTSPPAPAAPAQPTVSKTLAPELVGIWEQRTKSGAYDIVISEDIAPWGHYTISVSLAGQQPQKAGESGTIEAQDGHYKTTGDDTHMQQPGTYTLDTKADTLDLGDHPPQTVWKRASHQSQQNPPGEGTPPVNVMLQAPADGTALGWIAAARPIAKAWHHDAELTCFTGKTV
jgi:hypothetical protein